MTHAEFLRRLLAATTTSAVADAINAFSEAHPDHIDWKPVGRANNRGTIEVGGDPGKMLVERVTNAIDAILDHEHDRRGGLPRCRTPREAAQSWLGVSPDGLHSMTPADRRRIANKVVMTIHDGDSRDRRTVDIRDFGQGLSAAQMPTTILSLNEGNKLNKFHLAGAYGQGGSSTFAASSYTLIATRSAADANAPVAFSLVYYQDLPAEQYKHGQYVYMVWDGRPLETPLPAADFQSGTLVRHYGYDLSGYPSPLGERSVYGLLQQGLFDPVMPVWLEDKPHNYRRVIKGSRNALNGAADEEAGETTGPEVAHRMELFHARLGDFGTLGIEYWVLPYRERTRPNAAFVNPLRPIIFTHNGQSHGDLPASIIKKDAELPYLTSRIVVHLDCNGLSPAAKRGLFVSNREDVRSGEVLRAIREELVRALRSDEELGRLNTEAEQQGLRARDEDAERRIRSEVARMLRVMGLQALDPVGGAGPADAQQPVTRPGRPRGPRPPVIPIPVVEPPTLLEFVGDRPVKFYPGQRRYLRIRTNAPSSYHSADPARSRFNLIVPAGLTHAGTTPLNGGRMRVMVDALADARIGSTGTITLDLTRPGMEPLRARLDYEITPMPETPPTGARISLPPFNPVPVTGPDDENWTRLEWPEDVSQVASQAVFNDGHLTIYYSLAFPNFVQAKARIERQSIPLAESYRQRYEIWVCMHSLLIWEEQRARDAAPQTQGEAQPPLTDEQQERVERAERCRLAVLASMFAAQEVQRPEVAATDE